MEVIIITGQTGKNRKLNSYCCCEYITLRITERDKFRHNPPPLHPAKKKIMVPIQRSSGDAEPRAEQKEKDWLMRS
jgi:hypothetical protein